MKRLTATLAVLSLAVISTTAVAQKLTLKDAKKAFSALTARSKSPTLKTTAGQKPQYKTYKVKNKKGKIEEVKVWVGKPALIKPVDVEGGEKPAQVHMGVKVWAELSDENGTHTGKLVNIQRYKWQKNEHFYFWFETATPVQMSLVQYYDVGPSEAKKPRLVSPNRDFPKTYATVPAGEATYFPQLFKTDDNLADEFAMLTLVAAGESVAPPEGGSKVQSPINDPEKLPATEGDENGGGIGAVFKDTDRFYAKLSPKTVSFKKSPKKTLSPRLLQAVDEKGTPDPSKPGELERTTYDKADEACLFVLGSQTVGHLPLRFWKK